MEYKALKDIAKITMGQSPDSSSYNEEKDGLPFFQGNADFGELYPNERVWCNEPKKVAESGDILISVRAPIGALNYAKDKCCIGRGLAAITIEDEAERNYVFHLLKARNNDLNQKGTGSTFKAIGKNVLEELAVPQINRGEQQKCMDMMDLLESIIRERKSQLDKLDELIKARFVELFGDPRINPFGYDIKELGKTCKVITGNTPSRKVPEYYGSYLEWIKTDNIVAGLLNPTEATESLSESGAEVGRYVDENAILMACIAGSIASIGRVCVTDRRVAFNQQINAIVSNQYNTLFLYTMLQISKDYLVEDINMALKGILSKSKLEKKIFIVPPLELQNQFADFVKQVDKSKVVVQKALNEAQTLFNSLMQEYFE